MGKIQVYNKKFQNSKLSKIRFWLKQVFIEKKQMVPFEGEQSLSDTVSVYAIPRACIWFNCSKQHNNALNVHKIIKNRAKSQKIRALYARFFTNVLVGTV